MTRAPVKLAINGKFLSAPPTGVHRVAAELAVALGALAKDQPEKLDIELWLPADAVERAAQFGLPSRILKPLTWIPWEQLRLPFTRRNRILLNLCNIGPIFRGNAITMIHDAQVYLSPESYSKPFRLWYKFVQPALARASNHILTVSDYSRHQIADAGICKIDSISVVHNGADHILREAADPTILQKLSLARNGFVAALATVQAHKNIGLLLQCFRDPRLANIPLVLIGGDGREAFKRAGFDIPPNVIFTGRINDSELRAVMEAAICLAFPSLTEGFGLPPLEAMLLGCPAVVADRGALPEVCGDAVLYADPDRPEEWVWQIAALASDPDLRRSYAEAGMIHASRFTWRAAAERLLDIVSGVETAPSLAPSRAKPDEVHIPHPAALERA